MKANHMKNLESFLDHTSKVGVVGLGYVGLPLASVLAKKFKVVGFDISKPRIQELLEGKDRTGEVESKDFHGVKNLAFTCDPTDLALCSVIIVAVPTPIDRFKKPNLAALEAASKSVGLHMAKGTVVCFESTVYPGLTESICKDALERHSGLTYQKDFFLGYSPERVNPGDKNHTIDKIVKVVSGSTPQVLDLLAQIYGAVIGAGIHRAPSIATAEAAKVIENIQRDVNIGLVNELSQIFDRIGLDTQDVLAASRTKWNFLDFRPGLVGGHCIGVDPYYMTHLAEGVDFHPHIINSGRRVNDSVSKFIAEKIVRLIMKEDAKHTKVPLNVGILGVTFKEDVPDLRNTKVVDLATHLESFGVKVWMYDPIADKQEFFDEYERNLCSWQDMPTCDALVFAVKHDRLVKEFTLDKLISKLSSPRLVVDIKACLDRDESAKKGVTIWRP